MKNNIFGEKFVIDTNVAGKSYDETVTDKMIDVFRELMKSDAAPFLGCFDAEQCSITLSGNSDDTYIEAEIYPVYGFGDKPTSIGCDVGIGTGYGMCENAYESVDELERAEPDNEYLPEIKECFKSVENVLSKITKQ